MNHSKSIEQLENKVWPDPDFNSHLVIECHRLRKLPISDLRIEDLRLLISQKIGLKHILPLAFDVLERNPLVAGDMYDGDLLFAVASVDSQFWDSNSDLNNRLVEIKDSLSILAGTINNVLLPLLNNFQYK